MKYGKDNKPLVCLQENSTCYKETHKMSVRGILWHSTGVNNPNLSRYVQPTEGASNYEKMLKIIGKNESGNDWNHVDVDAGLNAWIGKLANGEVAAVQTMPWDYRPWGCGQGSIGSLNDGWIQFEICEDNLENKSYFKKVYKEAVELTAYLCMLYDLKPDSFEPMRGMLVPTITCHADAHKKRLASNHSDVNHWFSKYGKTMQDVRKDVAALIKATKSGDKKDDVKKSKLYRIGKSWKDAKSQTGYLRSLDEAKKVCKEGYCVFDSAGNVVYDKRKKNLEKDELYRVRKSWDDIDSQIGAYKSLENAKKARRKGYRVYDSSGNVVFPISSKKDVDSLYRIRKSWKDADSQIGAYESLSNAKRACKKGYSVYSSSGEKVYSMK